MVIQHDEKFWVNVGY